MVAQLASNTTAHAPSADRIGFTVMMTLRRCLGFRGIERRHADPRPLTARHVRVVAPGLLAVVPGPAFRCRCWPLDVLLDDVRRTVPPTRRIRVAVSVPWR